MASTERFGYEWDKYSYLDPNYEKQIINWIYPMIPSDFKGKEILDAGCGMGRNSYWCLRWGAKKITAFDYDKRTVKAAKKNLEEFINVKVEFKDISKINWVEEFDIALSIGVIHHLNNPKLAIKNLHNSIKHGGKLLLWVYSYEGNEWIVKYVNPIRVNITSKLPLSLVHLMSYFVSIPIWLYTRKYNGKNGYLKQLSNFQLSHINSIVFDQLIPAVANYWHREEIEKMLKEINLDNFSINQPPNQCGWTVVIEK
ncbi:class I SAM-dependent methyltransferase [Patescibacteria group bacterium]